MRIPPFAVRILVLAGCLIAGVPARGEEQRITILHTTDLHGALTGRDQLADRAAARGLTRIATLVERVRAEGQPVLLLDAGDTIEGSPLATVYQQERAAPDPMMLAMSRMGYDAMAVGNHEFNFGPPAIERARKDASFPWLAANILRPDGRPAFQPSLVRRVGALRVGVVGVCTPAVPFWEDSIHIVGLRFESPVVAARREVERLRAAERCDVVVVAAHTGLERDPAGKEPPDTEQPDENWGHRIATEVPGIDVLILGHTHVVVAPVEIGGALVSQAGKWGEHLGRVDLTLSRADRKARWKVASRSGRVVAVADTVPEDAGIVALAAPYLERAERALDQVVGEAVEEIASPAGRFEDGPIWELVHRAQLEATGADVSLAALFDPEVRIAKGPITVRDVMRVYVYGNTLGAVQMTGADLARALEHSARFLATYDYAHGRPLSEPGRRGFNFDSAEGVGYEIDLARPPGDRVRNLTFNGAPLDSARRLMVAVNNYRMNGGGGFEAVRTARRVLPATIGARDALIAYLRKHRPIDARFTRNWSLLPDYVSTPERPLIDRLVREGLAPRSEVHRLGPRDPARRGDLAYWLSRAFGWRETRRLSGAFPDVPDSLEPWLDGLMRRGVLGDMQTHSRFEPFEPVALKRAVDWCERAARRAGFALPPRESDHAFRRSLTTGVALDRPARRSLDFADLDTLTRAQLLGVISNTRFPTLRVLETTDFHGAINARGRERGTNRVIGGTAVLAAWIAKLRAENPEGTILIDGGDLFQGTMISNLSFGRSVVEQMNALGYVAAAIGNHEFDWGVDTLVRRVHAMRFPALGANLRERRSGRMPRWARSDTAFVRRGVRVGLFGLCYPETPHVTLRSNVAHLRFDDDSATAARIVPRLRSRDRAEVVIGVGHIPATADSAGRLRGDLARLARGIKGVDAWFGGHSHNRVSGDPGGVPAMIAGSHGEMIAVCDLVVDPLRDRVIERRWRLQLTYADEVRADSAMEAKVARWNAEIAPIASEVLGRNLSRLNRARGGEALVGNLVTDAMRSRVGADIALQNSGGLRADLPEGVVTRERIYEVMPFENTVVTMDLTGAEVKRVLEEALRFERVTQVSGIKYVYDLGAPEFERVLVLTDTTGRPLDELRVYRVACNDFMAEGGDNYDTLSKGLNRDETGVPVRDELEAYVRERSRRDGALDYRPEGRVVRAPGTKPPARPD